MLRLKQGVFAQTCRLAIQHEVLVAQRLTHFGVGSQGINATVNVHRCVVFNCATVGGCNIVIGIPIGLQNLDGCGQHASALAIGEGAQCLAPLLASKIETGNEIQSSGINPD